MNAVLRRRLAALTEAVFRAMTPCNCGGQGARIFFRDNDDPITEADNPPCPLHGPVAAWVFGNPTRRPPGYDRRANRGLTD
jgi:hypothetical protein